MLASLHELYQGRELLWMWALRSVKSRYQQTVLGVAWAIMQPLALTTVYTIVFSLILKVDTGDIPYPLFVYAGLLPWSLFASSVSSGVPSMVQNMDLITKIYFPREVLPVAALAVPVVDFFAGILVLSLLMVLYAVPLNVYMLLIPLLIAIQLLFTVGIVLAGSAANVLLRDIGHLVPLVLVVWQFATPIVYPLELVPERWQPLYLLNPMAILVASYKRILLLGEAPQWRFVAIAFGISLVTLAGGYWVFKRAERTFADVV